VKPCNITLPIDRESSGRRRCCMARKGQWILACGWTQVVSVLGSRRREGRLFLALYSGGCGWGGRGGEALFGLSFFLFMF